MHDGHPVGSVDADEELTVADDDGSDRDLDAAARGEQLRGDADFA